MLRVNERHVRVGSGGCSKIGLSQEQIKFLKDKAKKYGEKVTDKTYLVKGRRPIALLHLMCNTNEALKNFPKFIFAIGLGFPGGKAERTANYVVNTVELKNWVDTSDIEDEEDDI